MHTQLLLILPSPEKGPFTAESISIIIMPVRGKGGDVPPENSASSIWRAPRTSPADTTLLMFRLCGGERDFEERKERGLERSIISSSPWETPSERGKERTFYDMWQHEWISRRDTKARFVGVGFLCSPFEVRRAKDSAPGMGKKKKECISYFTLFPLNITRQWLTSAVPPGRPSRGP